MFFMGIWRGFEQEMHAFEVAHAPTTQALYPSLGIFVPIGANRTVRPKIVVQARRSGWSMT